ncbi:MAG: hypothetical protein U0172_06305 [Nitrospiraceae bacterium]
MARRLCEQQTSPLVTSRKNIASPPAHSTVAPLRFDLHDASTWPTIAEAVGTATSILWCFPAEPLHLVQQFATAVDLSRRPLVVLGSTGSYRMPEPVAAHNASPPDWVDERSPLDETIPRVQGEEWLREHFGAVVLRVAGIYGPGRYPLHWIRQGRVGASPKFVNLIHVEDLAQACIDALDHGGPGQIYNVSDGAPRAWKEICEWAARCWGIVVQTKEGPSTVGKRIDSTKLRKELGVTLRYPDLYAALETIEQTERPQT